MGTVNAAVVESFGKPPRYTTIPAPAVESEHELVDVLAVGIHPATRGVAAGKHYTNTRTPPRLWQVSMRSCADLMGAWRW